MVASVRHTFSRQYGPLSADFTIENGATSMLATMVRDYRLRLFGIPAAFSVHNSVANPKGLPDQRCLIVPFALAVENLFQWRSFCSGENQLQEESS